MMREPGRARRGIRDRGTTTAGLVGECGVGKAWPEIALVSAHWVLDGTARCGRERVVVELVGWLVLFPVH